MSDHQESEGGEQPSLWERIEHGVHAVHDFLVPHEMQHAAHAGGDAHTPGHAAPDAHPAGPHPDHHDVLAEAPHPHAAPEASAPPPAPAEHASPTPHHGAPAEHASPPADGAHGGGLGAGLMSGVEGAFNFAGMVGSVGQIVEGGQDLADGHGTLGMLELASGGINGLTSWAGATAAGGSLLGAAPAELESLGPLLTPEMGMIGAIAGSLPGGERELQRQGTWGTSGESSGEMIGAMAGNTRDDIYNTVVGDSHSTARQMLGGALGNIGGASTIPGSVGLAFGGELYNGVPEQIGSLYNTLTRPGAAAEADDIYGPATHNADGSVHHVTAPEFVETATGNAYTGTHDAVAGLFGPNHDTMGEIAGSVAGAGMGMLAGAGAGAIGLANAANPVTQLRSLWGHFAD